MPEHEAEGEEEEGALKRKQEETEKNLKLRKTMLASP